MVSRSDELYNHSFFIGLYSIVHLSFPGDFEVNCYNARQCMTVSGYKSFLIEENGSRERTKEQQTYCM
ncbi:hypothetical protein ERO13_D11G024050v2 [Gossypium hirsutum]|uniref:Uncharacterized protein n=1 Tax=Gossypium darwinii TaxID=34276 RepID=A0A5D2AI32_GOSDA|nr:hypothetical protein ERO13_D11G024050v2 [Gossypium hirsutum]TYG43546.1 hypothetical protein ES288_D11G026100v1 [Gossypium darwinii]